MDKLKKINIFLVFIISFIPFVFAGDIIGENIASQVASSTGSSNSLITFSSGSTTEYWNLGNNSEIIGNYFVGYYYDTLFGFFKLDWSSDKTQNVKIVSGSDKCIIGYGYKLGGYAKSDIIGKIDFDYNDENYVYYCKNDKKLHGKAYNPIIGYQSFEGIGFEIFTDVPLVDLDFITLKKKNNSVKIYVDGMLLVEKNDYIGDILNSDLPLYIGTSGHTLNYNISSGIYDEVRIYNRALSDSEIKALYEATK